MNRFSHDEQPLATMKINFTKQEYRSLLDLIHIADWVLHAHDIERRPDTQDYIQLMQKLLSYAKEMGYEELVDYDKRKNEYPLSGPFEMQSEAHEYVEEFEDNCFWSELIARLSDRDAVEQAGVEQLIDIELEKRFKAIGEAEQKWTTEFENFGLRRIRVDTD
ncbi:MAG: hypothetical protein Kow0065_23600 [Methylomicrobium sp.]